ncbi:uncharacterized protein LOC127715881 [Mytilus californianus]|uniref:uncharacterized protein LOC127715881 n=1 Tax=Mytilus californianus TaxID=6549 RepID=UPI0022470269|nr:uncharacterized protein LOC127715881 [Mytilus californianus]
MSLMNKVESFTWKSCGGNGFGVTDLSLTPDPLEFPGTLHLAMKAYFNTTIQAPLPTTLLIEKEVAGKYIKIPCIDSFGSCSYDDLCELLDEASCPDPLVKAGIPCQCPFKPAQYTLPTSDFDVETSFFPSGGYHMKGSISMNGKLEGCLEIFFIETILVQNLQQKIIMYMFVFLLAVFATFTSAKVLKVEIQDEEAKIVQFTMNNVESFTWKNCGGQGAGFTDLSLTPDPLQFPGTIHISAKAYINTTVQAPLPATLLIEKEVAGKYIKIPCIDSFGSCTYDDVCELLDEITCPDPIVKAGIPCQCPFKPAQYTLPTADFDVDTSFFPSGGYHIKGSISMNGQMTGCLDIYATVA